MTEEKIEYEIIYKLLKTNEELKILLSDLKNKDEDLKSILKEHEKSINLIMNELLGTKKEHKKITSKMEVDSNIVNIDKIIDDQKLSHYDDFNEALNLIKDKKYKKALSTLNEYLKDNDEDDRAWSIKANTELILDLLPESLGSVEKALELNEKNSDAIEIKAILSSIININEPDKALKLFDKALDIEENPRYLFNKGKMLHRNGKPLDAFGYFKRFTVLKPNEPCGWCSLGIILNNNIKLNREADRAFKKALKLDPSEILTANCFQLNQCSAIALANMGSFDEAIKMINEAIKKAPKNRGLRKLLQEFEDAKKNK